MIELVVYLDTTNDKNEYLSKLIFNEETKESWLSIEKIKQLQLKYPKLNITKKYSTINNVINSYTQIDKLFQDCET